MPAPPPPVKPRTQVPGKLNMGDFHKVSAALTGLKLESPGASPGSAGSGSRKGGGGEDDHGYAVPKDNVVNATAAAANGIEGGSKKGPAPSTPTQGKEYFAGLILTKSLNQEFRKRQGLKITPRKVSKYLSN